MVFMYFVIGVVTEKEDFQTIMASFAISARVKVLTWGLVEGINSPIDPSKKLYSPEMIVYTSSWFPILSCINGVGISWRVYRMGRKNDAWTVTKRYATISEETPPPIQGVILSFASLLEKSIAPTSKIHPLNMPSLWLTPLTR